MSTVVSSEFRDDLRHAARQDGTAVLRLGYVALVDAAPLLVAEELGLFRRHGLRVALHLVPSWASVRDRLAFGVLHGAQLLAPMAVAGAAGLGGISAELRVVSTLSLHGNAVVLGMPLWNEIAMDGAGPLPAAALARVAAARRARGVAPVRLAVVYPYSSHNYMLRHWLASAGVDPDADVELVVVPPADTVAALQGGAVDGFCAGAPWGGHAEGLGIGRVAACSSQVWPQHPEKVLAVTQRVLEAEPGQVAALIRAVLAAAAWLGQPEHRDDAVRILAERALLLPAEVIRAGLIDAAARPIFPTGPASFPHPEHGAAWIGQMRRWGHLPAADQASNDQPDPTRIWDGSAWRAAAIAAGVAAIPEAPAWPGPAGGFPTRTPAPAEDAR